MSADPETSTQTVSSEEKTNGLPAHEFSWLWNEHALRDEGAFYGLVEGQTEEKENAIRQYFAMHTRALQTEIEHHRDTLVRNQKEQDRLETKRLAVLTDKAQAVLALEQKPQFFLRHILGLLAYAGMLLFNFFLLYENIQHSTSKYPFWLSLGVYLFGMLAMIRRLAPVYSDEDTLEPDMLPDKDRWKTAAEAYGIPFVVALFVVVYGYHGDILRSALTFFLLFALFVYAGKGFWQSMEYVQREWEAIRHNRKAKALLQDKLQAFDDDLISIKDDIIKTRQAEDTSRQQLNDANIQLARAQEQAVASVSYFKSEYELARSSRRLGVFGT